MKVTITWRNDIPDTIWSVLARKLGREPTHEEACAEVKRILNGSTVALAEAGKLPHQRGRIA